jgi:hypothetical protein
MDIQSATIYKYNYILRLQALTFICTVILIIQGYFPTVEGILDCWVSVLRSL